MIQFLERFDYCESPLEDIFSDMVALEVFYILTLLLFEFTLFLFSQSLVFLFFLFSAPSVIDYSE